ncbi:MAG: HipA domain-containing protein [Archangium sp.]|nr:HipA domain-containing protein [Archangium sp.]
MSSAAIAHFFDQLALSVLVQNGDAHLKNFGVLYDDDSCWLAPMFDVVTTTLYSYDRAGIAVTDRTMALKLNDDRRYPLVPELIAFGEAHGWRPRPIGWPRSRMR